MVMLQNVYKKYRYLTKKVNEIGILIDKPKCEKPVRSPENIAAVAENAREAPLTSIQHFGVIIETNFA